MNGVLAAGVQLVWRRRRVLWRVYAVHLLLAAVGTLPAAVGFGRVLDHSLAADGLRRSFDLALLGELLSQPDASPATLLPAVAGSGVLFLLAMLFLNGGVLTAYRTDAALTTAEFYGGCSACFGRFLRLALVLVAVLVPFALLARLIQRGAQRLAEAAARETQAFAFSCAGALLILLLLLWLRLWFDMAQVHAVAKQETAMRRALAAALRLTLVHFPQLVWIQLRIVVTAAAGLALLLWLSLRLLGSQWPLLGLLAGQAVSLLWLAARLWQRASQSVWYQRLA